MAERVATTNSVADPQQKGACKIRLLDFAETLRARARFFCFWFYDTFTRAPESRTGNRHHFAYRPERA